jgi:pterin-4a-carbinolamine dehydratase
MMAINAKLTALHEDFIKNANQQMLFGRLPISAKQAETPILAKERWRILDGYLVKKYIFRVPQDRNRFIIGLLNYEQEVGHNALLMACEGEITIKLITQDVNKVTEIDKEYASYCDVLYRDVVYSSEDE